MGIYLWLVMGVIYMSDNKEAGGKFLGIRDAAQRLALHPETLRRWGQKGTITTYRTPNGHRRFLEADVDAILQKVRQDNEH